MALAGGLALASMCLSFWFAFQSPRFVAGIGALVFEALMPSIIKAVKPRDLTMAEIEKIVQG